MDNKLQELTDKLYREGLSRGKEEGEALLAKAEEKASGIIDTAQKKAKEIILNAEKEAAAFRTKVEGDVKMAAIQSIQTTRKSIEDQLLGGLLSGQVKSALSSSDFVKEMIMAVARNFNPEESVDFEAVLPENLKKEMEPFLGGEMAKIIGNGLNVRFSKDIEGGLNIGPKDGSYFISLTDKAFEDLIREYLRPAARKVLFGE